MWFAPSKISTRTLSRMSSNLAAIIQFTATSDKEKNFKKCADFIKLAKERNAKVAFVPEAFDFIAERSDQTLQLAEGLDGETISNYRSLAKQLNISLSLGGFHQVCESNKTKNTHLFIDGNGGIVGQYCKTHLFDVDIKDKVRLKESDYVIRGEEIGYPIPSDVGNVGLQICYDLRFPELSLILAKRGADILTFPSAFTVPTGYAHWESLLRARAIETQCYVVAAAQTGKHNDKRSSYGHSMIIDPWGTVIAQCGEGEGIAVAEIDLSYLSSVRSGMQVWKNRRDDLYGLASTGNHHVGRNNEDDEFQFGHVTIPHGAVVFSSPLSVVSVNKKPVLPGHLLVMPKRQASRMTNLTPQEVADLFLAVQNAQRLTEMHYGCDSSTVSIQDGQAAGQTVSHLHVHVLPRKEGDFKEKDEVYEELYKHDKEEHDGRRWRTELEMLEEADALKETCGKLFKSDQ